MLVPVRDSRLRIGIAILMGLITLQMAIAVVYTLVIHANNGFSKEAAHWVMFPFFKDHTIYGAIVALVLPFAVGLYYLEKRNLLLRTTLIFLFIIIVTNIFYLLNKNYIFAARLKFKEKWQLLDL